jgi:Xaa-Pro aminopeptidase
MQRADATPPRPDSIHDRVSRLREAMALAGVDFFLVPSSDAHQSEYVPEAWQRRAYISGFTGSMGDALVGHDGAWVFADSRYWLQGEAELAGTPFSLVRLGDPDAPDLPGHLRAVASGRKVGFDPRLHTMSELERLEAACRKAGADLVAVGRNLVDAVREDIPPLSASPVSLWPEVLSGESAAAKLSRLRAAMEEEGADWLVVATLDELAWTFNIRGADVDFNPIVIGWGLIGRDSATLFVDLHKVSAEAAAALDASGVALQPYAAFDDALLGVAGKVWVDPASTNGFIARQLERPSVKLHSDPSPVLGPRAKKNATELDGMRRAHIRDGVAVTRFLAWLEGSWREGVDELRAAERLAAFRAEGERFVGLSFDTIAGFGPNGAIVHYRSSPATTRTLDDSTLFLLDSGGQYLDGTTDITRTLHLGTPTDAQREHYTRVLRGHLALGRAIFPHGTTGTHLDALARGPLWEVGLNYGHGTGHGVGCYLSVHQGPHRVSPAMNTVALEPGMILSNEPGFYLAGEYGIRIENLVAVVPHVEGGAFGRFHAFEDLTLVPYCRALIAPELLDARETAQVDAYHARVRETLLPFLRGAERDYLLRETEPLGG